MHVWNETVEMVIFLFRSSGNNKDQIMCNFAGMWYMYTFAKISLYFTWWRRFQNGFWAEHLRWKLYLLLNGWFASNQFPAPQWSIIVLSILFASDHFLAPELICSTISLLCFWSVPCFWTDLLYCQSYTYIFAATTNIKTSVPYNSVKKLCAFSQQSSLS
jgi:hypothetical protein